MSRQIKFRVWGAETMFAGETLHNLTHMPQPHTVTFLQYTGLKDADGKEIYEGDIVEWGETGRLHPIRRAVGFEDEVAGWLPFASYVGAWKSVDPQQVRVIGNIYQDPHPDE